MPYVSGRADGWPPAYAGSVSIMPITTGRCAVPRRTATLVLGGLGVTLALAGCHIPGGAVHREVLVEFVTPDSAAAQKVVAAQCGHLPGVTVDPSAAGDPNVHLDVTHASEKELGDAAYCVAKLQQAQPKLQIRDYRIDDGLAN